MSVPAGGFLWALVWAAFAVTLFAFGALIWSKLLWGAGLATIVSGVLFLWPSPFIYFDYGLAAVFTGAAAVSMVLAFWNGLPEPHRTALDPAKEF